MQNLVLIIKSSDFLFIIDLLGENQRIQQSAYNNFENLYNASNMFKFEKFISTYFLPCRVSQTDMRLKFVKKSILFILVRR